MKDNMQPRIEWYGSQQPDAVIYKYEIPLVPMFDQSKPITVQLPSKAVVLCVQLMPHAAGPSELPQLMLWAIVRKENNLVAQREFYVIGTGRPLPEEDISYIGTVFRQQMYAPPEVFHVFQKRLDDVNVANCYE